MIQRHRTRRESNQASPPAIPVTRSPHRHCNSRLDGSFHQGFVQARPANAQPVTVNESALRRHFLIDETDSAKRNGIPGTQLDAECFQRGHGVRHQPFAAGLIDRRLRRISEHHPQPALADCDPRG